MDVVTGAGGFLGGVLVGELTRAGRRVRALSRRPLESHWATGAEVVAADVRDPEALAAAVRGAERVYHAAGVVGFGAGDRARLYEVNVGGTRNVVRACLRAGVERLIHVSSIEAVDLRRGGVVDESAGFDPGRTLLYYGRTKALATRLVLEASRHGLDTVAVCPTGYLGPEDTRPSAMGRMVLDYLRRRLPAGVSGGFDFADIRDVAHGCVLAAERGRSGEAYILSGRYVTVSELFRLLQQRTGVRPPLLMLPAAAALPIAAAAELWYAATRGEPRFTRGSVSLLALGVRVSAAKAARELGYHARPFETTVDDTLEWMRRARLV